MIQTPYGQVAADEARWLEKAFSVVDELIPEDARKVTRDGAKRLVWAELERRRVEGWP